MNYNKNLCYTIVWHLLHIATEAEGKQFLYNVKEMLVLRKIAQFCIYI